jgi:hypothetical protein
MNAVTGIRQGVRIAVWTHHFPEDEVTDEVDAEAIGAQPFDDCARLLDPPVAEVRPAGAGELHPILLRPLSACRYGPQIRVFGEAFGGEKDRKDDEEIGAVFLGQRPETTRRGQLFAGKDGVDSKGVPLLEEPALSGASID